MSVSQRNNVAYGLSQALITEAPTPIISKRSPTASDFATPGTVWTNVLTNQVYILASIVANAATWVSVAGGAGVFSSLTVTPGPISLTGTTTINTTGNATTSIGTGGTGLVNIGNTAAGTNISGALTVSGGTIDLNITGTAATHIGNGTGNTFIDNGNFVVTTGSLFVPGNRAINFTGLLSILAGTGDPNGTVTAAQGSLFLRTDGSGTANRAYINTDSLNTWTAITTAT